MPACGILRPLSSSPHRYKAMTKDMGQLYSNAKVQHSKGLTVLENEFGYHPAFKR